MKTKRFQKRLTLNKKTVVNLNSNEKQGVKGGAPYTLIGTCSCVGGCGTLGNTCETYCGTCGDTCDTCSPSCGGTCHTCQPCTTDLTIAYTCTC